MQFLKYIGDENGTLIQGKEYEIEFSGVAVGGVEYFTVIDEVGVEILIYSDSGKNRWEFVERNLKVDIGFDYNASTCTAR